MKKKTSVVILTLILSIAMIVPAFAVNITQEGKITGRKNGDVAFDSKGGELSTGLFGEDGTPYIYESFLWEFDYTSETDDEHKDIFSFLIDDKSPDKRYSLVIDGTKVSVCKDGDLKSSTASADFESKKDDSYTFKIVFVSGKLSVYVYPVFDNVQHKALIECEISDRSAGAFEVSSKGGKFAIDNFTVTGMESATTLYTKMTAPIDPEDEFKLTHLENIKGGGISVYGVENGQDYYVDSRPWVDENGDIILAKNFVFEFDYLPSLCEWQRDRIYFLMDDEYERHDDCYVVWFQGNSTGAPTFSGYRNNHFNDILGFAAATYYTNVPCRVRVIVTGTKAQVYMADPDFAEFDVVGFEMTLADDRVEKGGFGIMSYAGEFTLQNMMIFAFDSENVGTFGIQADKVKPQVTTESSAEDTSVTETEASSDKPDDTSAKTTDKPVVTTAPEKNSESNIGLIIGIAAAVVAVAVVAVVIALKKKKK